MEISSTRLARTCILEIERLLRQQDSDGRRIIFPSVLAHHLEITLIPLLREEEHFNQYWGDREMAFETSAYARAFAWTAWCAWIACAKSKADGREKLVLASLREMLTAAFDAGAELAMSGDIETASAMAEREVALAGEKREASK